MPHLLILDVLLATENERYIHDEFKLIQFGYVDLVSLQVRCPLMRVLAYAKQFALAIRTRAFSAYPSRTAHAI